jgi:hypothetical protein
MEDQIMKQTEFDVVMNRIMHLTEYEVEVSVPDDFEFYGEVPYDMSIAGDKAWVKVLAENMEEAKIKANEYFEGKYK